MQLLAEVTDGWIVPLLTVLGSMVGGGGIATVVSKYFDSKKEIKQIDNQSSQANQASFNTMMMDELKALQEKDRICNDRVTKLEKENWAITREAQFLRDRLLQLESDLITAVISANSQRKIIKWNSGATLMFGYLESEMIGQDVEILIPGNLKQRHHDAYETAINDLDAVTDWKNARPIIAVHKDGHEFPAQLVISSFRNTSSGEKFFEARINRPRAN